MLIFVGTKNPSKLFSVQAGYREYHPNDKYTVAVFAKGEDNTLGDLIRTLEPVAAKQTNNNAVTSTAPVQHHIIIGVEVDSGVAAQPFSAEETLTGGRNRAAAVKAIIQASSSDILQAKLSQAVPDITTELVDIKNHFYVGIEGGIEKVVDKWLESGYIIVQNGRGVEGVGTSSRFELANFVIDELNTGLELCEVVDRLSNQTDVRSTQGYMGMITNTILDRARAYNHGVIFAFSKFEGPQQYWDECDRTPQ